MSLTPGSICQSDKAGSPETITLTPVPPAALTNAAIAAAFYGVDASSTPIAAPVSADRKSVTISVLSGINSLVITLVSPTVADETVCLGQGANIFATPTIHDHTATSTIYVKGI